MNNENKKLSRNRMGGIEGKNKMSIDMKLLLNKVKSERKKIKDIDKTKQLEILLVNIKYANNPNLLQNALKQLNNIQVIDKNLQETKQEILQDYTGVFEMFDNLKVGNQIRETHTRFRNTNDYEAFINLIDEGYDAEDSNFSGYIYKNNTPQFNLVNRSQNGNECDFKHEILDYQRKNCYIPTKGSCFVKCIIFLTGGDYKNENLNFIRNENRRPNIMTMARIQPCLKKLGIDLGYFNGDRVYPRTVMNSEIALYLYINHFC